MSNPKQADQFDANARAKARENRPINLGDRTAKPARKTPPRMRRFRALIREDATLGREVAGLNGNGELDDLAREELLLLGEPDKPRELSSTDLARLREIADRRNDIEARFADEDEQRLVEIEDRREELLYEMVMLLVDPADDAGELTLGYLTDNVDIEEVRDLVNFLSPRAPGESEDPTTPTPATSS